MSYYAAGGYYRAGGFSFKKLGNFVSKVVASPVGKVIASVVPGASTIMAAMDTAKQIFASPHVQPAAAAAVVDSLPGTPGATAFVAARGGVRGRRQRKLRWRIRRR